MPVTSVADLINLLAARRQANLLHDRRTGMPYSWSAWLRARVSRALTAFSRGDVDGVIAARPAAPADPVPPQHPLWQVMLSLLWHGGDPPPRDQRGLRWFAGVFSALLHILFAALLLWVALVRSNVPDADAEAGERVQVEYIGRGTPEEEGGGAPEAQAAAASAAAGAEAAATPTQSDAPPAAEAQTAASEQAAASVAETAQAADEPQPMPVDMAKPSPEVSSAQPLSVTETAQPTTDFVLPPPTVQPPNITTPTVNVPEVQVRERTVETAAERPVVTSQVRTPVEARVRVPDVQVRERRIEVAPEQQVRMAQVQPRSSEVQLPTRELGVRERQIEAAPRESVAMAQVKPREAEAQVRAPGIAVRERQIPGVPDAPAAKPAGAGAGQASAPSRTPAAGSAQAEADSGKASVGSAAANAATTAAGTSPGAGSKPQDRTGGWAAPTRGDDWGASQRQVDGSAGGQADSGKGLFNADGSVRLAGDGGKAQDAGKRGAPGGDSDTWSRERIANSGTWLKRPPYDYTPTSFDKYWVPNESLLAEWVRKGIKSIEIPIPGSSSKISCVVSMLQFGGGCGLTNPNMQEQPAEARPPPDVPFKKELQEDNGSR